MAAAIEDDHRRQWEEEEQLDERSCRVCGCTDYDCWECIELTGEPCSWVDADLCSACVEAVHLSN